VNEETVSRTNLFVQAKASLKDNVNISFTSFAVTITEAQAFAAWD